MTDQRADDDEPVTAIGRVLLEYCWSQRPPLSVRKLARRVGLPAGTIHKWIHGDATPRRASLALVAAKTGIPRSQLDAATGYDGANEVWDYILDKIADATSTKPSEREALTARIRAWRASYEAGDGASVPVADHREPAAAGGS